MWHVSCERTVRRVEVFLKGSLKHLVPTDSEKGVKQEVLA